MRSWFEVSTGVRRGAWALAAVIAAVLATGPALPVSLDESRPGVWGVCEDPDGNPVPGVKVSLKPKGTSAAALTVTSTKKGRFVFPRLDLYSEGYEVTVEKDGWFVRRFEFRTRRGTREIWQDDSGERTPSQQVFPPLLYRGPGTNATVRLVMMKVEDFRPEPAAPAAAAPGAPPAVAE
ncbi:MAG: carboxypeptidase regulatory-like domain-containing protein, partial [Acidobacteria bacterium]